MHFLMWHERANWKINMMKKHWLIEYWNASYVAGQNVKLKCKHDPFIDPSVDSFIGPQVLTFEMWKGQIEEPIMIQRKWLVAKIKIKINNFLLHWFWNL
jgi:hypothetical protein